MSGWSHTRVGPSLPLMELKWLKFGREWIGDLNLRPGGATRGNGASSDRKDREWYEDIWRSKVVSPACVD
jgi:hypothetical protein